ncbi:MAG TPA: alginate lyase family protein [Pyrinomonadaceae bacterium]|nr:alginate lyase family protein [Pyrinomonadaceae bacterium]
MPFLRYRTLRALGSLTFIILGFRFASLQALRFHPLLGLGEGIDFQSIVELNFEGVAQLPNSSEGPNKSSLSKGIRSVLGGRVSFGRAMLEAFRRGRAAINTRRERALLAELASEPARLRPEFQNLSSFDLLKHFRERPTPSFFSGFELSNSTAALQRNLFPDETERLIQSARIITKDHRWPLLGFGEKDFGDPIDWQRDPLSGRTWPLDYHADIPLWHNDGSDIRVLWELNRLGHLLTVGRAYALTSDEKFTTEFLTQVESWREQNPLGRGANWSCAMEVALRAMNLLAAFSLFRRSPNLNEDRLLMLLTMFDQHGSHIRRNLEFTHIATSNHYLSDIAGLLWIAIMLPEFSAARDWREFALAEMLNEIDKQVLPDGPDYESSTGYHRFVLELLLYSFLLCRANEMKIPDKYWRKLHTMLGYLCAMLRPDGFAPLIGDTDGGQVLPIVSRNADDHCYLLALGATAFNDSRLKIKGLEAPPELLWTLGEESSRNYEELAYSSEETSSKAFPDAGTYVLRHDDLFLLFNANGAKTGRPASHRHNDALSVEVSACGRAFMVDPGTFVYTADLCDRHRFRSTAYHSTIQINEAEQNTTDEDAPFVIGGEARVEVLFWESTPERDRIVAEHSGYERLAEPAKHRRTITFYKPERWWLIEDEILGSGEPEIAARFHFDAGLEVTLFETDSVLARDTGSGAYLIVRSLDLDQAAELEAQFTSRHYGSKDESVSACWTAKSTLPSKLRWAIMPVCAGEDIEERLRVIKTGE